MPRPRRPGKAFHYSSFGYDVVGAVIEAVTGTSYGKALTRYVTAPLELEDTGYAPDPAIIRGLARGYKPDGNGGLERAPYRHISNAYAAGGMYSSASDLLRWSRALRDSSFIEAALMRRKQSSQTSALSSDVSYGYRLAIHDGSGATQMGNIGLHCPYLIHGGSFDGYRSLFVSAAGGITIVLLSNVGRATNELELGAHLAKVLNRNVPLKR